MPGGDQFVVVLDNDVQQIRDAQAFPRYFARGPVLDNFVDKIQEHGVRFELFEKLRLDAQR